MGDSFVVDNPLPWRKSSTLDAIARRRFFCVWAVLAIFYVVDLMPEREIASRNDFR